MKKQKRSYKPTYSAKFGRVQRFVTGYAATVPAVSGVRQRGRYENEDGNSVSTARVVVFTGQRVGLCMSQIRREPKGRTNNEGYAPVHKSKFAKNAGITSDYALK